MRCARCGATGAYFGTFCSRCEKDGRRDVPPKRRVHSRDHDERELTPKRPAHVADK